MRPACVRVVFLSRTVQRKNKKVHQYPSFILFLISFIYLGAAELYIYIFFSLESEAVDLVAWVNKQQGFLSFFLPHVFTHISLYLFFCCWKNLSSKITSPTFSYIYTRFLLIQFFFPGLLLLLLFLTI